MTSMDVGDDDFEEKIIEKSREKPVLVDFWAGWCMPCKQLSPVLDDVAEEMGDSIDLAKVNVDEAEEKAREYGVRSIPNVKLFVDGEVVDEFVGVKPKSAIVNWLEGKI